jgi:hypothetical protein
VPLQPWIRIRIDAIRPAQAAAIAAGSAFGSISTVILMPIVSPWRTSPAQGDFLYPHRRLGGYGDKHGLA